jgi:hypothetical protein
MRVLYQPGNIFGVNSGICPGAESGRADIHRIRSMIDSGNARVGVSGRR